MRNGTPARDEMVAELGEDYVEMLEGDDRPDGFDLLDRFFVQMHLCANGGPIAPDEVGEAYLRARAKGTCPVFELSDFYWNHWDVDGLCDIFPCPHCVEENVYTGLLEPAAAGDDDRTEEGDGDDHDETIPF